MSNDTGTLYCVATPIGNLADFSARAIETLKIVDCIAVEDTRHSQPLLAHFGIKTPMIAYHEHNEMQQTEALLKQLQSGKNIALISDAGTPLISDPGYQLIKQARELEMSVVPIPGACALIAALQASGLPTDRFYFSGFLPAKENSRKKFLNELKDATYTLIFYEAPHRILESLSTMIGVFGVAREAVLARELTKKFETFYCGTLANILQKLMAHPEQHRGEFVVLVHGSIENKAEKLNFDLNSMLNILLRDLPLTQAVKLAAEISGVKKNQLYQMALILQAKLAKESDEKDFGSGVDY